MVEESRPRKSRNDDALELAQETLRKLELGDSKLTPIVLRCHRLAKLVDHEEAERWFRCELRGYTENTIPGGNWTTYATWSGRESSKPAAGPQQYWIGPLESLEVELELAREDLRTFQLIPMTVNETTSQSTGSYVNPYAQSTSEKLLKSIVDIRQQRTTTVRTFSKVIATLRGSIQQWLSDLIIRLSYGTLVDTAFSRAKSVVDEFLLARAPEVAKQLAAAYERGSSASPEEWSQSLTSCRRALKSLADVLYPATEEKLDGRDLSEAKYRSRLIQFASDNLTSKSQADLVEAEIDSVIKRIEALDGLASKGVHDEVTDRDVDLTVVHTYLLAGELVMMLPEPEPTEKEVLAADAQGTPEAPPIVEAAKPKPRPRRRSSKATN